MKNHDLRLENDLAALRFIHYFGWLRIVDLARLMKHPNASALEAGARLARQLIARRLVLARRLPEGAGQALVLATAGVRLLAEHDIAGTCGKSIGQTGEGKWQPPLDWKHAALAHGVLCELFTRGYRILPEAELRRSFGGMSKLPDGLVLTPDRKQWLWLEVENARKSGPHMRHLAHAIVAVANAQVKVGRIQPSGCMVAYWHGSVDERGYQLDHRARVSKAVAAVAKQDIPLTFVECMRKGAVGIAQLELQEVSIQADRATAVLNWLQANGGWSYDAENNVSWAQYGRLTAKVWQDPDSDNWGYCVEGLDLSGQGGYAKNVSEAKRGAALLIANR